MPPVRIRIQLMGAASMWLVGALILLIRGVGYVKDSHWFTWILALGLALGVLKWHLLLNRVATKAVTRIQGRENASVFGFFSAKSWGLIAIMMGSGITLRHLVVHPGQLAAGIMGAIYVGIGVALLLADRVIWAAMFKPLPIMSGTVTPAEVTTPATTPEVGAAS